MSVTRAEYTKIFSATPKTERGYPTVISGGDPKGKCFLYAFGNTVFIRNIEDPTKCDLYSEHTCQVNVAKYSPSGFYIASGDESGKLRIWDTTQADHILKNEFTPFGGPIKDLAWSLDNQRIVCCGEGKESFASVFLSDTGTTTGFIGGHSKKVNSCDIKPTRPFRIVTGSEDMTTVMHEGPPFKVKATKHDHQNFVQCVRYSPNGEVFATASADKTIWLYEGKEGEPKGQFKDGETAHNGSVYSICFSPQSDKLLSVAADKTAKIWEVSSLKLLQTFNFGSDIADMQVGCLWQGNYILSLSLDGRITYLDETNPKVHKKVLRGHNKKITSLCVVKSIDGSDNHVMYSGDYTGNIKQWNTSNGDCTPVSGGNLTAQVISMANRGNTTIAVVAYDDTIRFIDHIKSAYVEEAPLKCPSQPQKIAACVSSPDLAVVGCTKHLVVVNGFNIVSSVELSYELVKVALSCDGNWVAVSANDKKIRIYKVTGTFSLELAKEIEVRHDAMNLEFSPNGEFLAFIDATRVIRIYQIVDGEFNHKCDLCFHSARIDYVSWHSDSKHLASAGFDTNIIVWNIDDKSSFTKLAMTHPKCNITGLAWVDDSTVASSGFDDCNIKFWNPKLT